MEYTKPRLAAIGSAVKTVQLIDKELGILIDSVKLNFTTNAYQADE